MSEGLHYQNAPITEAMIDLRVAPQKELSLGELSQLHSAVKNSYPKCDPLFKQSSHFEVLPGGKTTSSTGNEPTGFKLVSQDRKYICQARLNGFTFSRLAPYENWRSFQREAQHLWNLYCDVTQTKSISRIAVRYVNRFDLPCRSDENGVDLSDYFRTSPEISEDLPQQLSGFFMQLQLPQKDVKGHVLINQTIVPPVRDEVVSVILDIDLFRDIDLPETEEELWSILEMLHAQKNIIFEACITDLTRKLIH